MSTGTAEKSFADLARKYKPREGSVLALKHTGEPKQYQTEHGTTVAHDGDYVVQVGETEQTEHIPPRVVGDKRIPGEVRTHIVPKLEVMKAAAFEAIYSV